MKEYFKQTWPFIVIVLLAGFAGIYLSGQLNPDYNPNYARAIEQQRPELCTNINYALSSQPNDELVRIEGGIAMQQCEMQAEAGELFCECNSDSLLAKMKRRW